MKGSTQVNSHMPASNATRHLTWDCLIFHAKKWDQKCIVGAVLWYRWRHTSYDIPVTTIPPNYGGHLPPPVATPCVKWIYLTFCWVLCCNVSSWSLPKGVILKMEKLQMLLKKQHWDKNWRKLLYSSLWKTQKINTVVDSLDQSINIHDASSI